MSTTQIPWTTDLGVCCRIEGLVLDLHLRTDDPATAIGDCLVQIEVLRLLRRGHRAQYAALSCQGVGILRQTDTLLHSQ